MLTEYVDRITESQYYVRMSAQVTENGRIWGVDESQHITGYLDGIQIEISGMPDGNGFQSQLGNMPVIIYRFGDPALPLTLDDGRTIDAIKTATPADLLEPML